MDGQLLSIAERLLQEQSRWFKRPVILPLLSRYLKSLLEHQHLPVNQLDSILCLLI
jgi:inhibitor of KinA sporulation pathway (predicted exonuclease)